MLYSVEGMPSEDISMPSKDISMPSKDISMPSKDISMPSKDISKSLEGMPSKDISMPATVLTAFQIDIIELRSRIEAHWSIHKKKYWKEL